MGAFADGIIIGNAVGTIVGDRRASRRLAAIMFTVLAAAFIICATVIPHAMEALANTGESSSGGELGPLFGIAPFNFIAMFVIVIAGAKFTATAPFSVFKVPQHVIASMRTSVACIVMWAVLIVLSVLTFMVITNAIGLFFMDLLIVVVSLVTGRLSIGAFKRVQDGGAEVQEGIARAVNSAPESVQLTWAGPIHSPTYIVALPYILQQQMFPMIHQNIAHALPTHQVIEISESRVVLTKA